jgi:hypothetical protein
MGQSVTKQDESSRRIKLTEVPPEKSYKNHLSIKISIG